MIARATDIVATPRGLRFLNRHWPATYGRGGVTRDKREGDGATPAGVHRIVGLLYRADRIAKPVDWAVPIGPFDLWSDDPADADYNLMVRAPYPHSHERLHRGDRLYDLVILTDWNWPRAERGRGSAIFLHRWRAPAVPTAGCIALPPARLAAFARGIRYETRLFVPPALAGRA